MRRLRRRIAAVAVVGVVLASGMAYLAANTVNASSSGEGRSTVTVSSTVVNGQTTYQVSTPSFLAP